MKNIQRTVLNIYSRDKNVTFEVTVDHCGCYSQAFLFWLGDICVNFVECKSHIKTAFLAIIFSFFLYRKC